MFDVFVEGAVATTPDAVRRLADTMAVKFGLSADDFVARLVRGRVRVKAKVDRSTADAYMRELVKIGARCTVEESRPTSATPPAGVRLATPPGGLRATTPPPAARTAPPSRADLLRTSTPSSGVSQTSRATPPVGSAAQRPPTSPRAASASSGPTAPRAHTISAASIQPRPPAPLVAATFRTPASGVPTKPPPTSGLSAATTESGTPTNLGALDTSSPLALSSLDGTDAMTDSSGSFGPPLELDTGPSGEPGKLIASKPAAIMTKSAPSKDRPKDEPLDLFAPPDAGEQHVAVEIAADELEYKARRQMSTPPPMPVVAPPRDATPIPSSPASAAEPAPPPARVRSKLGPLADIKIRFAAGVVAAILVGFLPATVIASIRERSAFKAIDDSYVEASIDPANQNPDLDGTFLDKKRSARREIAITSMLIWALGGGAIAYVWFRRVPWNRWA